ncbi:DUF4252 domain-containing protein [Prevotella melaninogenica]|uniref:DUF4252 domain-containing protein n=1 Tax=Prevotella TaxID=838 RepID=UPI0003AD3935|nr:MULTISPECIES: DUF4252 domain-containing protein [Prevotella]ERJ74828.1 hypothetical protein HMPREF9148_02234 [Prevotella sp. F0091]QUB74331.1 DUF4252 domain-containing protein [Prevotella melaninogenica]
MKTTIFTIAFAVAVLCSSCTVKANPKSLIMQPTNDEVESIFKEFKSGDNVTYVNLPKTLIKLGLKAANDETANALAKQIDELQILTFEEADQKTKDGLYNRISKLESKGYEPMIKTNEDGEKVRIFIKGNEKEVQSLVIFAMDKEDCSLINIVGHINPSNIDDIVKSQTT